MRSRHRMWGFLVALVVNVLAAISASAAPNPTATYLFNSNTFAQQGGVPALSVILDASGASSAFVTDTPFGVSKTVLQLTGAAVTAIDAGLQFNNAGALLASNNYSAEIVFEFTQNPGTWRAIVNANDRTKDAGFYLSPGNVLNVYPNVSGPTIFNLNQYYDVVYTNSSSGGGTVKAYLNGNLELTSSTSVMNIGAASLLDFFLDDTVTGKHEFSSSRVAMVRLFNSVLSDSDVATLYNGGHPFGVVDTDGDGIPDSIDNCPFTPNGPVVGTCLGAFPQGQATCHANGDCTSGRCSLNQEDTGGIGTGSSPDGIGDACQCGDVNNDGIVNNTDATLMKRAVVDLSPYTGGVTTLPGYSKCQVVNGAPGLTCNNTQATLIQRAVVSLAPGIVQGCHAATIFP